eukprot:3107657-Rhodomonas_salina.1
MLPTSPLSAAASSMRRPAEALGRRPAAGAPSRSQFPTSPCASTWPPSAAARMCSTASASPPTPPRRWRQKAARLKWAWGRAWGGAAARAKHRAASAS